MDKNRDRNKRRREDPDRYRETRSHIKEKPEEKDGYEKTRSHKETDSTNKRDRQAEEMKISGVPAPSHNGNGEGPVRGTEKGTGRSGGCTFPHSSWRK